VVRGEPERIQRAISNLVDNALKWSPEGGTVEIEVRLDLQLLDLGQEGDDVALEHGRVFRVEKCVRRLTIGSHGIFIAMQKVVRFA
jgi:signal transduction histidine kinase